MTRLDDTTLKTITKATASLKLRAIGPAVMGGRISDITVHPTKRSIWYVTAGSGSVWKSTNAGITWTPIFDDQPSYSIGCVTLDPSNPEIVWVGTGENVSGRHVGWGDGVYKSVNGGQSWQQMGLETSEHIGKILIDPRDGNVVYVAAEGPLWCAGGERGLYKTSDGGETWTLALEIDENTGVTSIQFDPANPDIIYAAAYQRRRHIWALMGGGPSSGIYKSTDAGATWRRITQGLPKGDMGKIGLATTPADPSLVYATIEAGEKEKGFYRSTNRGESWEKRSDYISGGTGPHYYQKIEASPSNPDLVYQMDVFVQVTKDGGKSFNLLETGRNKHSDNHALWIDPDDGLHLLCGSDAGLYESFDGGDEWRHNPNMPLAQFYRVDIDNAEPFYNVLGGAQDLGTLYGPSRTLNVEGVRNQDWSVPTGADGYHVAFDPTDPNIFYCEFQNGNLFRYDKHNEEVIDIKPQPEPSDPPERWNWDAPILVSPHDANRLYFASQRVWRSDDRGNSWTAISGDLTRDQNRYELAIMGRVWSVDDLYDNGAMSQYNTISSLSESPKKAGIIYAATDDGLIQVTENGGKKWRQAANLPDVPKGSFIQCVTASQHNAKTVYAVAGAHKIGDFSPYIFVSNDRGKSWQSIVGDLPDGTIVWAIEQDHVNPELLFIAAEYGLYCSLNGGKNWLKLSGNVPTIAFRDLKLHRRDNDLVGATFGRGFYVLDDYTPLRELSADLLDQEGHLFPVRDAWWYIPYTPMQARNQPTLGSTAFKTLNPDFGATFTYFLKEGVTTQKEARNKAEKDLRKEGQDAPFPGWEKLREEAIESKPQVLLLIRNQDGEPIRWVDGPAEEGLHRVTWDLRLPAPDPVRLTKPDFLFPWSSPPRGPLVAPGSYSAELFIQSRDGLQSMGEPQHFELKPIPSTDMDTDFEAVATFQHETSELYRRASGAVEEMRHAQVRIDHIRAALVQAPKAEPALFAQTDALNQSLEALRQQLIFDSARSTLSEPTEPTVRVRIGRVAFGHWNTRQAPTKTQRRMLEQGRDGLDSLVKELSELIEKDVAALEAELEKVGAPWTPGRKL